MPKQEPGIVFQFMLAAEMNSAAISTATFTEHKLFGMAPLQFWCNLSPEQLGGVSRERCPSPDPSTPIANRTCYTKSWV